MSICSSSSSSNSSSDSNTHLKADLTLVTVVVVGTIFNLILGTTRIDSSTFFISPVIGLVTLLIVLTYFGAPTSPQSCSEAVVMRISTGSVCLIFSCSSGGGGGRYSEFHYCHY